MRHGRSGPDVNTANSNIGDVDLSIVIVNRNTADFLEACLRSLETAVPPRVRTEIEVIDNASTDDSVDRVKTLFPRVRLVPTEANLGFARANNHGIALATGRYILFLNPDTLAGPSSLGPVLEFLEKTPDAGAATCRVELADGSLDDAAHRGFPTPWNALCHFSGLARLFPYSRLFAGYSRGWEDMRKTHEIEALAGAFMLVRREAGESVGWWDEDYFFYGDDLDFCYRLKRAGWLIYFVADSTVLHYKGVSSGIRSESHAVTTADTATRLLSTRARFEAMRIFYRKHYRGVYPAPLTLAVLVAIWVKEAMSFWGVSRARGGGVRRGQTPREGLPG